MVLYQNIGLPFVLLLLLMFEKMQNTGAFYPVRLLFLWWRTHSFQPNEYDNNKLLYVWYALCAVLHCRNTPLCCGIVYAACARYVVAVLTCGVFFLSGSLSIARETVSNYQLFSPQDVAVAEFAR